MMRKKSKYKPKPMLANPLAFVVESVTPVAQHEGSLLTLKLKNHNALAMLVKGQAGRKELDMLINALNTTEALVLMGFGSEYAFVAKNGLDALLEVCKRGMRTDHYILKGAEMQTLDEAMQLHDEQLEIVTVGELDRSQRLVRDVLKLKKATVIDDKENVK
jgi:hypothetical protein